MDSCSPGILTHPRRSTARSEYQQLSLLSMGCCGNSRDSCATGKPILVLTQESRTGQTCEEQLLGPHRGAAFTPLHSALFRSFSLDTNQPLPLHPPATKSIPTQPLPSAAPGIFQKEVKPLPGCQHLRSRSQLLPTGPAWQLPAAPPPTHRHQLLLGSVPRLLQPGSSLLCIPSNPGLIPIPIQKAKD